MAMKRSYFILFRNRIRFSSSSSPATDPTTPAPQSLLTLRFKLFPVWLKILYYSKALKITTSSIILLIYRKNKFTFFIITLLLERIRPVAGNQKTPIKQQFTTSESDVSPLIVRYESDMSPT